MAVTDIRLSVDFFDHPKTVKLERRHGLPGLKALLVLWKWAAKNRTSGPGEQRQRSLCLRIEDSFLRLKIAYGTRYNNAAPSGREGAVSMPRATLELSRRKELYRRFRNLSERNAARVLGYIDALEEEHPSDETLAALREVDRIARDPSVKGFTDVAEMMDSILAAPPRSP
jgi:hypothetical protein